MAPQFKTKLKFRHHPLPFLDATTISNWTTMLFGQPNRPIYGPSWRFFQQNKLVFSYQKSNSFGSTRTKIYDLAVDISF
jgi:hypothetical protein